MKRYLAILAGGVLFLSTTSGWAIESCVKCHKSMDKVKELVKATGAKSADELVKIIRTGKKAALHKAVTDEDIKKSFAESSK